MNLEQGLEIEVLYELNKQHLSDLDFFDDEQRFIRNIFEKSFIPELSDIRVSTKVQLFKSQLLQLDLVKATITQDALTHQTHLTSNTDSSTKKSFDFLKLENKRIEDELRDLNKSFKKTKREFFSIYKVLEIGKVAKSTTLS